MSYILDALRKSEQERQRGKVPDLNSYKDEPATETKRRNIWPWVTLAVVVVNIVVIAFIWMPRGAAPVSAKAMPPVSSPVIAPVPIPAETTPASVPQAVTSPVVQSRPAPAPVPKPTLAPSRDDVLRAPVPQPVPNTVVVDSRPPVQSAPTVVDPERPPPEAISPDPVYQPPAPSVAYMPQLEELPPNERAGIPDMTFSSHMYSSIPRFRSIIINGKRLKEGEYFSQNLQVREITDKGVIMSNGNVLFSVDVLGRWAQ